MLKLWPLLVVISCPALFGVIDGKALEISSYARVAHNNGGTAAIPATSTAALEQQEVTTEREQERQEISNKTEVLNLGQSQGLSASSGVAERASAAVSTGRAAGGSAYPFLQSSFPLLLPSPHRAKSISTYAPQQHFYNHAPETVQPRIVYSQRPSVLSQVAEDRFAPGEAYASTIYKLKQEKLKAAGAGNQGQSSNIDPVSAPLPTISSYGPQPSGNNAALVSSFNPIRVVPSPATPVFTSGFVNSNKLLSASSNVDSAAVPPPSNSDSNDDNGDSQPTSAEQGGSAAGSGPYFPPSISELYKFPPNNNYDSSHAGSAEDTPSTAQSSSSYLPPASGDASSEYLGPYSPQNIPTPSKPVDAVKMAIEANSVPVPKPYVISAAPVEDHPPPATHPEADLIPDYPHESHDHGHDFNGQYGYDASPEVIFDYDPTSQHHPDFDLHAYHHDHHHEEPPPEPTTTLAPEEPAEPRVKKYSYYYLGRKLWYVPLFFTLWFCFYVSALIIKSIARHKVQVPNHWQHRRRRALVEEPHSDTLRKVNKMTYFVMNQLTNFEHKYKGQ